MCSFHNSDREKYVYQQHEISTENKTENNEIFEALHSLRSIRSFEITIIIFVTNFKHPTTFHHRWYVWLAQSSSRVFHCKQKFVLTKREENQNLWFINKSFAHQATYQKVSRRPQLYATVSIHCWFWANNICSIFSIISLYVFAFFCQEQSADISCSAAPIRLPTYWFSLLLFPISLVMAYTISFIELTMQSRTNNT